MNISRLFFLRPVATTLSMLAIILAGVIAYRLLPVSAFTALPVCTRSIHLPPGLSKSITAASWIQIAELL